jgi:hypothetical protein
MKGAEQQIIKIQTNKCKSDSENVFRFAGFLFQEIADSVGDYAGLSAARTGRHQQRPGGVADRFLLFRIQTGEELVHKGG